MGWFVVWSFVLLCFMVVLWYVAWMCCSVVRCVCCGVRCCQYCGGVWHGVVFGAKCVCECVRVCV